MAVAPLVRTVAQDDVDDPVRTVRLFDAEVKVAQIWSDESARVARDAVIEHVTVLPMIGEGALPDRTVTVERGMITSVVPSDGAAVAAGVLRIDGRGKFLVPGLVDMHVHRLASMTTDLLLLLNGVTSVRDMDGFPWMLRQRRAIEAGRLLAPTPYIAGHILNAAPMGIYATVVRSPAEAREAVREQARSGYDFIKIHNVLPRPLYDAVVEESRAVGLDVIGHVPHEITIAHAIAAHQRTLEHLKGYVLDTTLEVSGEDWLEATRGAEVWITPTLYAAERTNVRGRAAERALALPEMRFVPELVRKEWSRVASEPLDEAHRELFETSVDVLRELLSIDARVLVGTDSGGGYDFMVPGFATHDEMELLQSAGMTPLAVLDAATAQAAAAMRRERELGAVVAGRRADLVLVDRDPSATAANLRSIAGVMVRGVWLGTSDLDLIAERLATALARTVGWPETEPERRSLVEGQLTRLEALAADGFVLPSHAVAEYAAALEQLGLRDLAARGRVLAKDERVR